MSISAAAYMEVGDARDLTIPSERRLYRVLEILPGFLAWTTLIGSVLLSIYTPTFIAIFIIIFDLFWLVRISFFHVHMTAAFRSLRKNMKINWRDRLETDMATRDSWRKIHHLVIFPFYKEDLAIVQMSLEAIRASTVPLDRFIIVLAGEERAKSHAEPLMKAIETEYAGVFGKLLMTLHPHNLPGELAGKGANINWAGQRAKEYIDQQGIAYQDVIVSPFDIDTITPADYFARLTHAYLTTENRLHASYQPIPLFTNNIWDAPIFSVISGFSTTFWAMLNQERPHRLKTFSSHSMPFQAIVDVGFWKKNMVSDDNIIFFQCFFRYNGNYRVVPLYYPVSMDSNVGPTLRQTAVNVYKQHRRHGWGVETIPYMIFGFIKNKAIPLKTKLSFTFEYLEGFWSWSTNSLIIALLGSLPILLGGRAFRQSVLSVSMSSITGNTLHLCMIFLVFSAFFTLILLPPRPKTKGKKLIRVPIMVVQWLLTPVIMIFFGALPALDAQTRLMLGKYMGFWVTPKTRKS